MWRKMRMVQPGDIWLLVLLVWSFPLLGISLGILFPTLPTGWQQSNKPSIAVPAWRQDLIPLSAHKSIKKTDFAP